MMRQLVSNHARLVAKTRLNFKRYLYPMINWENRLIVIKGAKGVGKTTLILQHIKETFGQGSMALYVSADSFYFASHNLYDLAEYHYTHGGTHLFVDEIHKYIGWQQYVKNIYDSFPDLHLVLTGSSLLHIEHAMGDLSRRCKQYTLYGMSFREYLELEGVASLPVLTLDDILSRHVNIAAELTAEGALLGHFENYLHHGFYPFYREAGNGFEERVNQVIETIIFSEMPAVSELGYESIYKVKPLLGILAAQAPYTVNVSALSKALSTSRPIVLKLFALLHDAAIVRQLFAAIDGITALTKPDKILFDNTNLMYALAPDSEIGTVRETFVGSMLGAMHTLTMPNRGDFLIDGKCLLEVGGPSKGYRQIAGIENSYVIRDGIDIGEGNKIPMWLLGLLY